MTKELTKAGRMHDRVAKLAVRWSAPPEFNSPQPGVPCALCPTGSLISNVATTTVQPH